MDVRKIVGRWPSRKEFAADIGEDVSTVTMWIYRGSIPAHNDVRLMKAAKRRGVYLTYEELAHERAAV